MAAPPVSLFEELCLRRPSSDLAKVGTAGSSMILVSFGTEVEQNELKGAQNKADDQNNYCPNDCTVETMSCYGPRALPR